MPYGKTMPYEMVCKGCKRKLYAKRKNKNGQKKDMKKFCKTERKVMDFSPKQTKHSN